MQNKISQPRHAGKLLGIHGDMDREKAIKAYLEDHPTIKIITTYDSLPAVCQILEKQGIDVYHNIHLVIDE